MRSSVKERWCHVAPGNTPITLSHQYLQHESESAIRQAILSFSASPSTSPTNAISSMYLQYSGLSRSRSRTNERFMYGASSPIYRSGSSCMCESALFLSSAKMEAYGSFLIFSRIFSSPWLSKNIHKTGSASLGEASKHPSHSLVNPLSSSSISFWRLESESPSHERVASAEVSDGFRNRRTIP